MIAKQINSKEKNYQKKISKKNTKEIPKTRDIKLTTELAVRRKEGYMSDFVIVKNSVCLVFSNKTPESVQKHLGVLLSELYLAQLERGEEQYEKEGNMPVSCIDEKAS